MSTNTINPNWQQSHKKEMVMTRGLFVRSAELTVLRKHIITLASLGNGPGVTFRSSSSPVHGRVLAGC